MKNYFHFHVNTDEKLISLCYIQCRFVSRKSWLKWMQRTQCSAGSTFSIPIKYFFVWCGAVIMQCKQLHTVLTVTHINIDVCRSVFHNRHIGITHCAYYIFSCLTKVCVFSFFLSSFPSYVRSCKAFEVFFFFFLNVCWFDSICSFSRNSKSAYGVPLNYLFRWHH